MNASSPYRKALAVFAKQPVAGQVKTRLAEATSPEFAVKVAEACLYDTLQRVQLLDVERYLVYSPGQAADYFAAIVPNRFHLEAQSGGDLGQRLTALFHGHLHASAGALIVLGSDSPSVPIAYVEQAFRELDTADVVLGPATDGGYYLLGCTRYFPELFESIAWGSSTVLADTVARVRRLAVRLALLPPWYDVDRLEDWNLLGGHIAAMRLAGFDPGLPHTESLLGQSLDSAGVNSQQ